MSIYGSAKYIHDTGHLDWSCVQLQRGEHSQDTALWGPRRCSLQRSACRNPPTKLRGHRASARPGAQRDSLPPPRATRPKPTARSRRPARGSRPPGGTADLHTGPQARRSTGVAAAAARSPHGPQGRGRRERPGAEGRFRGGAGQPRRQRRPRRAAARCLNRRARPVPALPGRDAVQRFLLQPAVAAVQPHHHLVPLRPAPPRHHGPQRFEPLAGRRQTPPPAAPGRRRPAARHDTAAPRRAGPGLRRAAAPRPGAERAGPLPGRAAAAVGVPNSRGVAGPARGVQDASPECRGFSCCRAGGPRAKGCVGAGAEGRCWGS